MPASLRSIFSFFVSIASVTLISLIVPAYCHGQTATETTLQVTTACPQVGCLATLTATVSAGATMVHPGLVYFCDGNALDCEDSAPLGEKQLLANGTATLKTHLRVGTRTLKAIFEGTKTYGRSVSTVQTVVVSPSTPVSTATNTVLDSTQTSTFATFDSLVQGSGNVAPTGIVSFLDTTNSNAVVATAPVTGGEISGNYTPRNQTLPSATENSLSTLPQLFMPADVNNDGFTDVLSNGNNIVLLGNGTAFTALTSPPAPNCTNFNGPPPVLADFNGDGNLDIATPGTGGVSVCLGKGDGTFTNASPVSVPGNITSMASGDFNGDGIADIALLLSNLRSSSAQCPPASGCAASTYSVILLTGVGNGTFTAGTPFPLGTATSALDTAASGVLTAGDVNRDGAQDLVVVGNIPSATASSFDLLVLKGENNGAFTVSAPIFTYPSNQPIATPVIADMNNDGFPDIVLGIHLGFSIYDGTSSGTFVRGQGLQNTSSDFVIDTTAGIHVADFNGDGTLGLAYQQPPNVAGVQSFEFFYTQHVANGPLVAGTEFAFFAPIDVAVGDFHADGLISPLFYSGSSSFEGPVFTEWDEQQFITAEAIATGVAVPGSGVHTIVAKYGGDSTHSSSVSNSTQVTGSPLSYSKGFAGATGLMLNGGAAIQGSALELTDGGTFESRSFFGSSRYSVTNGFATDFTFQLTNAYADGFAFVIQSNGPDALGSPGGGLGYGLLPGATGGPRITNSLAVKFDLHSDQGEGNNSVGVYTGGVSPTIPAVDLTSSGIDLHSGDTFHASVVCCGNGGITLTIIDLNTNAVFTHTFPVNLLAAIGAGPAYAGFTAATGAETAIQKILSWTFTPFSNSATPVEPSYPTGFAGAAGLVLSGGAEVSGSNLQLTDNSTFLVTNAYFTTQISDLSFTTDFDFNMGSGTGDGFTFVLQPDGVTGFSGVSPHGSSGGGLGYGPSTPGGTGEKIPNSLAVKFDLHNNAGEGTDSTGVYLNGASPTTPAIDLTPSGINLHNGHTFHAHIVYDGTTLTWTIVDLTDYRVFTTSVPENIPAIMGNSVYVGFTSATGASTGVIHILNWTFVQGN